MDTQNQKSVNFNEEQQAAIAAILAFMRAPFDPTAFEFVLSGSAGTGKTTCIGEVLRQYELNSRKTIIFTAPTNKATKVLRSIVKGRTCCTTYSLLGLRLEPSGEVKTIAQGSRVPPIAGCDFVVVDEGSMANKQLHGLLRGEALKRYIKVIYMGDPAQLPPVKETHSPIWDIPTKSHLDKVMRHDNQILALATHIRSQVDKPFPQLRISSDADNRGGVLRLSRQDFDGYLRVAAKRGDFTQGTAKAIAWRNVIVNKYNEVIRSEIMGQTPLPFWKGDRIIAISPCVVGKDPARVTLLHTDDEATVDSVSESIHPRHSDLRVLTLKATRTDDNEEVTLHVVHPAAQKMFTAKLKHLADNREWRKFWGLKDDIHEVRHAYAITAHRSQGSTYDSTYVDFADILHNPNKSEGVRCLYVACTRSRRDLFLTGG